MICTHPSRERANTNCELNSKTPSNKHGCIVRPPFSAQQLFPVPQSAGFPPPPPASPVVHLVSLNGIPYESQINGPAFPQLGKQSPHSSRWPVFTRHLGPEQTGGWPGPGS